MRPRGDVDVDKRKIRNVIKEQSERGRKAMGSREEEGIQLDEARDHHHHWVHNFNHGHAEEKMLKTRMRNERREEERDQDISFAA